MRVFARRRVPFIGQLEATECGAACLGMILSYHGCEVPLSQLRSACGVSRDGASAADIVSAAEMWGFACDAVYIDRSQWDLIPVPAIVHWQNSHFVVLESVSATNAAILDPAIGRRSIDADELWQSQRGVALLISPTPAARRQRATRAPVVRQAFDPIKSIVLQAGALAILLQPLLMSFPWVLQFAIDAAGKRSPSFEVGVAALAVILATCLAAGLQLIQHALLLDAQLITDVRLMKGFASHLVRLPLSFFLARRAGDILNRVQSGAVIRESVTRSLTAGFLGVVTICAFVTFGLLSDPYAGLLLVVFVVARIGVSVTAGSRTRVDLEAEVRAQSGELDVLSESLRAHETVTATRSFEARADRLTGETLERINAFGRRRRTSVGANALIATAELGTAVAFVLYSARQIVGGQMSAGTFVLLLLLLSSIRDPVDLLLGAAAQWRTVAAHLVRIEDILDAKPNQEGVTVPVARAAIRFDGVSFRYSARSPWVVRALNCSIAPGEKVAIAGPIGSGKSTLARLMLGLVEPTAGKVWLGDVCLADADVTTWRRRIGVVPQEPFLFNDTVFANIALGDIDVDDDRVRGAARLACLDGVIARLPLGYETVIGEDGITLSGGERQRVAIARALVRQPDLLLLDEATSALDLATEAELHNNLAALACTRIVISHRREPLLDADVLMRVSDKGVVVERRMRAPKDSEPSCAY